MNTQSLNTRITSLFEANKQTLHLIHRLAKLPAQPGSSPLNPDAGDARLELSAEIHQNLKEQDEQFELLQQEVKEISTAGSGSSSLRRRNTNQDTERTSLTAQVSRLGGDLKVARAQFRKAQLQAKRNAEAAKRKEREILFAGIQEGKTVPGHSGRRGQEKLTQDELLVNASSDVTAALRRTHALMQSEVSRSQFAHETLQQSTAALSTLSESYSNLDTLLSSSRSLVSDLISSQKSDTWYLESAFWILISTIAWLIFRRFLYGPAWWLLYLPTSLIWRLLITLIRISIGSLALFSSTSPSQISSSLSASTSLIIKPSATGGPPRFYHSGISAPSIAVGAGGAGAKDQQYRPPPQESNRPLSEAIGQMAEQSRQQQKGSQDANEPAHQQQQQQQQQSVKSASTASQQSSGTMLRERRSDEPPNPKKRMWEENNLERDTASSQDGEMAPRDEL